MIKTNIKKSDFSDGSIVVNVKGTEVSSGGLNFDLNVGIKNITFIHPTAKSAMSCQII